MYFSSFSTNVAHFPLLLIIIGSPFFGFCFTVITFLVNKMEKCNFFFLGEKMQLYFILIWSPQRQDWRGGNPWTAQTEAQVMYCGPRQQTGSTETLKRETSRDPNSLKSTKLSLHRKPKNKGFKEPIPSKSAIHSSLSLSLSFRKP